MNHSARRINLLGKALMAQNYLEIGVSGGETFADVTLAKRTAVDPQFLFDTAALANDKTHFHKMPSDQYFAKLADNVVFDLVFIDGLHKFEQVVRDFSNAIIHSHAGSVIVLDDTKPSSVFSAIPTLRDATRFRQLAGVVDTSWHGDVYKMIPYLHDFWPAVNYRTIIGSGNPQTFVWRSNNFERKPRYESFEFISRFTYNELIDNIDLLRECDEETAMKEILADVVQARLPQLATSLSECGARDLYTVTAAG